MTLFQIVECLEVSKLSQLQHFFIIPVFLGIVIESFNFLSDFCQFCISLIDIGCTILVFFIIYCALHLLNLFDHFVESIFKGCLESLHIFSGL